MHYVNYPLLTMLYRASRVFPAYAHVGVRPNIADRVTAHQRMPPDVRDLGCVQ
jgi:hypothetical protein